jgi:hypothetical protein
VLQCCVNGRDQRILQKQCTDVLAPLGEGLLDRFAHVYAAVEFACDKVYLDDSLDDGGDWRSTTYDAELSTLKRANDCKVLVREPQRVNLLGPGWTHTCQHAFPGAQEVHARVCPITLCP